MLRLNELKYYIKNTFIWHLLLLFVFCGLSMLIVSFRNLSPTDSAAVMEQYLIFIGIILFAPIVWPECDKKIWDLVSCKKYDSCISIVIRVVLSCILVISIVLIYEFILFNGHCKFNFLKLFLGSTAEQIFIGSIAFFFSALLNNIIVGYMVPILYYLMNLGGIDFGVFALFQMKKGMYSFWPMMLIVGLLLIFLGSIIRNKITFYVVK